MMIGITILSVAAVLGALGLIWHRSRYIRYPVCDRVSCSTPKGAGVGQQGSYRGAYLRVTDGKIFVLGNLYAVVFINGKHVPEMEEHEVKPSDHLSVNFECSDIYFVYEMVDVAIVEDGCGGFLFNGRPTDVLGYLELTLYNFQSQWNWDTELVGV